MKARFFAASIAALFALPLVACASADGQSTGGSSADQGADVEDLGGKADGVSKPVGTFELSGPTVIGQADIALLVLKTDNTVHGMYAPPCKTCMPAQFDGTYKFTKSTISSRRYIKMALDSGTVRYEYKMNASTGTLKLRNVDKTNWFSMSQADSPWCEAPSDCDVQGLMTPKCAGQWSCGDSTCSYECGTQQNACESAGGSCVPLVPDACANGTVGDANQYSCGGGLGVECCLPKKADCRTTGCDSGKQCVMCWGSYACIPDGAVC